MAPATEVSHHIAKVYNDIVKSENDKNEYRGIELTNGLKLFLISDASTDKSAAALAVRVGYASDPWEFPGLAHFCEHMLFLGTKKFLDESGYVKFITQHSGTYNAFTGIDGTVYFFEIDPDYLTPAFDRFSQFFVGPLFTESATDRELNAVNSENEKNLKSDPWRFQQLKKSLSRPGHDYTKFGTGNKETLLVEPKRKGLDVRSALLEFHAKHYSSNIMSCVVLGKETLDELASMTIPFLAEIPNKNAEAQVWPEHPYGPEQLKIRINVVPVKDLRRLQMQFPIPDNRHLYRTNPGRYLAHLVGHEGPGSLLSQLKAKGWANALTGGPGGGARGFSFFNVNVELTEDGLQHVYDIVTLFFQYVKMLQMNGPQNRIFNEIRDLGQTSFRFKEKDKSATTVTQLVDMVPDYPFQELLTVRSIVQEFAPQHITDMLNHLTPQNVRLDVVSKQYENKTDKKEEWYGTDYSVEPISPDLIDQWTNVSLNPAFHHPEDNSFIPSGFDLTKTEDGFTEFPVLIRNTERSRLWFLQDKEYNLPKAVFQVQFKNPLAYHDPHHKNLTHMFSALFVDALTEYAYAATLAGLRYSFVNSTHGIQLSINGYSDKQSVLLEKIIEKMVTFSVDSSRFDFLKDNYVRRLQDFQAEQPYQHAVHYTSYVLSQKMWSHEELLREIDIRTFDALQAFIPKFLSRLHIEVLAHGNFQKAKAESLLQLVEDHLKKQIQSRTLLPTETILFREHKLPDSKAFVFTRINCVHPTTSVHTTYQVGLQDPRTDALVKLLSQICKQPCFEELRTKQQLGYIVTSGLRKSAGTIGIRFIVQSDRTPQYVDGRIEDFLLTLEKLMKDMSEEEFETHKTSVIIAILERPKKLQLLADRYWAEITDQQYCFDRANIEVEQIKRLTKQDVLEFFSKYIAKGAPQRKKLSVHVLPRQLVQQNAKDIAEVNKDMIAIENLVEFKRSLALYPLAKPCIEIAMPAAAKL